MTSTLKLRRHYPGFVDPPEDGAELYELTTLEELRENEFILRWLSMEGFSHLAVSRGSRPSPFLLVAVMKDSTLWLLGVLEEGTFDGFGLPEHDQHATP